MYSSGVVRGVIVFGLDFWGSGGGLFLGGSFRVGGPAAPTPERWLDLARFPELVPGALVLWRLVGSWWPEWMRVAFGIAVT